MLSLVHILFYFSPRNIASRIESSNEYIKGLFGDGEVVKYDTSNNNNNNNNNNNEDRVSDDYYGDYDYDAGSPFQFDDFGRVAEEDYSKEISNKFR